MRPTSFALPLALLSLLAAVAPCRAADLAVAITGVRAQTGLIKVALVDSPEAYDGKAKPVRGTAAAPSGGSASFRFDGLPPGRYAVMVIHDENGNGKLDSNFLGMPTEGYGFSNNPRVMRKPTWDEAAFEVGEDGASIRIELR